MINPNELRIGNLINYIGHGHFDVLEITQTNIENIPLEKLEPIPLTPEILEKCGFEASVLYLNKHTYLELDKDGDFYYVFIKQEDTTDKNIKDSVLTDIEILHLHQLQNLYFALTGEEIVFKQP